MQIRTSVKTIEHVFESNSNGISDKIYNGVTFSFFFFSFVKYFARRLRREKDRSIDYELRSNEISPYLSFPFDEKGIKKNKENQWKSKVRDILFKYIIMYDFTKLIKEF